MFSTEKKKLKWFLTLKIDVERQIFALFDSYLLISNKSWKEINNFVISATLMWKVFIRIHKPGETFSQQVK